jgi:hypothetical protein
MSYEPILQLPRTSERETYCFAKKRLKIKGDIVYGNGCNSWKGHVYDKPIRELISTKAFAPNKCTQVHIIAALGLAYLAMVAEFGYVVVLARSGLLMREQFFKPSTFHPALPLQSQMILGGGMMTSPEAPVWAKPFSFGFQRPGFCIVAARNFGIMVPISRDPRDPVATHLQIVPAKYKLRPDLISDHVNGRRKNPEAHAPAPLSASGMARPVARRRAGAASLPEWIRPQLTQLVDQAPDGPDWLHEIKFDGYRTHARLDRGAVRLLTRTRLD